MKKVQKIYFIGALFVGLAGILFWRYINRSDSYSYGKEQPLTVVTADNIGDYFKPNTAINTLEPEQFVEIEGRIKEVNTRNNRHTIVLKGTKDESPYIICDMSIGQEKELKLFKENDTVKIKGIFKGFLKDAVFLNCTITQHNPNE